MNNYATVRPLRRHWWALLLLITLAGCNPLIAVYTHIGGPLQPGDLNYPESNPAPRRIIEVQVLAPSDVDVGLVADYDTDGRDTCNSTPTFIAGAVEGATFPSNISVSLELHASGTTRVGKFAVDALKPGRCNWGFSALYATLSKNGVTSTNGALRVVLAKNPSGGELHDTPYENSLPTPVFLRCDFRALPINLSNKLWVNCVSHKKPPDKLKTTQYLTGEITHVRIEVEDITETVLQH